MRRLVPVVVAMMACVDTPDVAVSAPNARVVSGARVGGYSSGATYDDELASFGENHRGFGGVHLDHDGAFVATFTGGPTASREEVQGLLWRLFGPAASGREIRFGKAPHSFLDLTAALRRFLESADPKKVTMVDIDEVAGLVRIGVRSESDLLAIKVPEGDRDVFALEQHSPLKLAQGLSGVYRPLLGGTQIGIGGAICSFGGAASAVAFDDPLWWSAPKWGLTAAHCTSTWGSVSGETVRQPATGPDVGFEVIDPPFWSPQQVFEPMCWHWSFTCRYSDAAMFQLSGGGFPGYPYPVVAATPNATPGQVAFGWTMVGMWYSVPAGLWVAKTGATTGTTVGPVSGTCRTVAADGNGTQTPRVFVCLAAAQLGVEGGDSGGAVVAGGTGTTNLHAGIVSGKDGSTMYFSTHWGIMRDFSLNYSMHCAGALPCH